MVLKDPRRIPEEKAATHEELTAAIEGLTRAELIKLYKSADYRIRGLGRAANGRDFEVLFQEAVLAFFKIGGRKWRKDEVDIVRTLTEAMRSIADSWKRAFDEKEAWLESELITTSVEGEQSNPLDQVADPAARNALNDLEVAEELAIIEKLLEPRDLASLILLGMKDGLTGPELQKELEISEKEYETEMKWIRRKARAAFKKGEAK